MTTFLQTIILYNFKSYKGKEIIGPLHDWFMTIVGRNGTGKSNIVDAIRFVCGDTLCSLGVTCLSKLVYINIEPSTKSYVTITFQINDNKERSFTRLIQGEDSQYKIDDEIVRSDVYMTALRNYGLDIKSENFLVSQNYVECIAMKTPKELTAMFEQICGSNVYKGIYNRLKIKLTQTENEVQMVQNMKKQLLMNKKCAIMEREKAEEYLQLQQQYVRQARKEKLQYQLTRLYIIKISVETLREKDKDVKIRTKEYIRLKKEALFGLESKKLELKSLVDSLDIVQHQVLRLEKAVEEKKAAHAVLEGNIAYWQKKRNCAHMSLDNANLVRDTSEKTIRELNNELIHINELAKLMEVSEQSSIELSNSQIEQYCELKNVVECQAKTFVKQMDDITRDQQADRYRLDNERRRKEDLEDKIKRMAITEENFHTRFTKLLSVINETNAAIEEKTTNVRELKDKIDETNVKSSSLRRDIAEIVEKLEEVDVDNYTVSKEIEKAEIIKTLKKQFCGVHDRVSNLCRPAHSRYKVAVTRVFGKNMDAIVVDTTVTAMQCMQFLKQQKIGVETFLPLDSLKPEALKERLRNIREPGVKLLYDVMQISSPEVCSAILFLTKSTLVCETPEDARRVAYEIDKRRYDCVSLDGVFYRKSGTITGGLAYLMTKAKQWDKQDVITLNEKKEGLKKQLNGLPNISLLQSELNEAYLQHKELYLKNKFIKEDMKNIKAEYMNTNKANETAKHNVELSLLNETISKIERDMQTRDEELESLKESVSTIEDLIFANFCRDINVPNIDYYEKTHLRVHQEQTRSKMELEKQRDRIQEQLRFEEERNIEENIFKWTNVIKQADARLHEIHEPANSTISAIEKDEKELSQLRKERADAEERLADVKNSIARCKTQIDDISESYLEAQKTHISMQRAMQQQKAKCDAILAECKIEDIVIPMSAGSSRRLDSSRSSSVTDSSIDWDASSKIDFSQFPKNIIGSAEENLQDSAEQLNGKLAKIQKELEAIVKPNFKARKNVDNIRQQVRELNEKFKILHKEANKRKKQFETVKTKRYNLFFECLERVNAEIDPIYKSLVGSDAMYVFILIDNFEEPYEGGVNYSLLAPFKHFQPLQNLSGGERTLASLALLFTLRCYKPAPFFVMDESDAALDSRNIKNIVRFIKCQANATKFIAVSHRESFYNCSDTLIGVATESDAGYTQSKVFGLSLKGYRE